MANQPIGVKKSQFTANNTILGSATFDYVQSGQNFKITYQNFLSQLGVTGTIVQGGNVLGVPVLDVQGTINVIRNLSPGDGIGIVVDGDNGITISQDITPVVLTTGTLMELQDAMETQGLVDASAVPVGGLTLINRTLVYKSANQSIPSGIDTAISWDEDLYDTGNSWTSGANVIVPAGISFLEINGQVVFQGNSSGFRVAFVPINGVRPIGCAEERETVVGSQTEYLTFTSGILPVMEGDIITLVVNQNSGIALNVLATAVTTGDSTWLAVKFYA